MPKKLFDYQEKIVNNCNSPGVALFMGMGTGKTVTSLALFKKSKCKKLLIICLVSKLTDWKDDLMSECGLDGIIMNKTVNRGYKFEQSDDYLIVNFESAWRYNELLDWVDKDTCIIIDESHKIKSTTSRVSKFCEKLKRLTSHKIILTGTPQSKGYIDYYNQLRFVDILNMPKTEFTNTFCVYDTMNYNGFPFKKLVGYKNTEYLDELIHDKCIFYERDPENDMIPSDIDVRIKKPKQYDTFKLSRIYKDYAADSSAKLFVGLRTCCSGFIGTNETENGKLLWLKEFIDDINTRVVIFYNFNREREMIIELLDSLKIPYSEYSGRSKNLDNFKQHPNGVAVCQYQSASTGLNDLVVSNICVMFGPPLNYTDWAQAKKRIDRVGQTKKPLYYNLYCMGTVENKILLTLKSGKDFDNRMFEEYIKND